MHGVRAGSDPPRAALYPNINYSINNRPFPLPLFMHDSIAQALAAQGNHELFAAHSYKALALWCSVHEYNGFAGFFEKQAEEEREHADKFFDHLLDRDYVPILDAMDAPRNEFGTLVEVAGHAAELERLNSEKIRACYKLALEVPDYDCQPMLMWFIEEQIEEEAWASKMVTLTERAQCSGALYNLDRHIEKELAEDE